MSQACWAVWQGNPGAGQPWVTGRGGRWLRVSRRMTGRAGPHSRVTREPGVKEQERHKPSERPGTDGAGMSPLQPRTGATLPRGPDTRQSPVGPGDSAGSQTGHVLLSWGPLCTPHSLWTGGLKFHRIIPKFIWKNKPATREAGDGR